MRPTQEEWASCTRQDLCKACSSASRCCSKVWVCRSCSSRRSLSCPREPAGGVGSSRTPPAQANPCPTPWSPHQLGPSLLLFQLQSQLLDLGLQELVLTARTPGRRDNLSGPPPLGQQPRRGARGAQGPPVLLDQASQALRGLDGGGTQVKLSTTSMFKLRVEAGLGYVNSFRVRMGDQSQVKARARGKGQGQGQVSSWVRLSDRGWGQQETSS